VTGSQRPYAEMSYDEQRAFLGLGYGPPCGYIGHKVRTLARAMQPRFAEIADGFRAMSVAMRPVIDQLKRDAETRPPYTQATFPKRGRR
jgi:hypothetical protein